MKNNMYLQSTSCNSNTNNMHQHVPQIQHIYKHSSVAAQQACNLLSIKLYFYIITGADPGFKVGGRGAHLNKLRRAEGGAKSVGVFRVKSHDFTPKNHIFSNCGGRRENIWSISCEKSRFYAKKNHIFSNFLGARAGCAPSLNHPLNQLAGYI